MTTPPTTADKALSLVPQIRAACDKATNATRGSLTYAIEAGDLLNSAKALPKKVGWLRWLEHNLPDVPERTATLYMRLAEHKASIDQQRVAGAIEEGKLSIRAAAKFIPKSATAIAAAEKRKATLAAKKALETAKQIEDLLRDLAVDEVYTALRNTMSVEDLMALAHMIFDRNEKSDIPPEFRRSSPIPVPPSPAPAVSIRRPA
jgi:hypothetical protein